MVQSRGDGPAGLAEIFRRLAGPITALPVCLIALPADWETNGWLAALAISLMPLAVVGSRISDTDLIMKALPDLVQQESLAGRELVISETHGALSTNLRLIEQQAREIRDVALACTTSPSRPTAGCGRRWRSPSSGVTAPAACIISRRRYSPWHVPSAQRLTSTSVSTRYPQIVILRG